ncbi:MAG: signal peptidase I [Bacilli bacterium]|nr:signal peptidase I [Bacilli bacterium]
MKGIKILINILLDILIFVLVIGIAFALYGFIQTKVLKKTYSNYFGYTYFQILTGSMEDTINIDDMVIVKITDKIEKDDIVSYKSNNSVITHRVIEVLDDGYITKGDNNNADDGTIEKDKVIGKVVHIGKKWGKVKKFIMEPVVIIPFIAMIVLFSWYTSLLKERSIEDEE